MNVDKGGELYQVLLLLFLQKSSHLYTKHDSTHAPRGYTTAKYLEVIVSVSFFETVR